MSYPHISVLLAEFLSFFEGRNLKVFIDGTLGAAGHAEALLKSHPEIELFIGIDRDPEACALAKKRLEPWAEKVVIHHGNYGEMTRFLREHGRSCAEGIFLDLGVSSMQFDQPEKGFSFSKDGPLDMRMNPDDSLAAEEIVNEWSESDLVRIFRDYGEEKRCRRAALAVIAAREKERIVSTGQLAKVLVAALPVNPKKRIHPATLVFQALRIAVNSELDVLRETLPLALDLLCPQGVLGVISFHSLEDRLVKRAFSYAASDKESTRGLGGGLFQDKKPQVRALTRKPIVSGDEELEQNSRSRSAKLRFVEKLDIE